MKGFMGLFSKVTVLIASEFDFWVKHDKFLPYDYKLCHFNLLLFIMMKEYKEQNINSKRSKRTN